MANFRIFQIWKHVRHSPKMYAVGMPERPKAGVEWGADQTKALCLTLGQAQRLARRNCARIEQIG